MHNTIAQFFELLRFDEEPVPKANNIRVLRVSGQHIVNQLTQLAGRDFPRLASDVVFDLLLEIDRFSPHIIRAGRMATRNLLVAIGRAKAARQAQKPGEPLQYVISLHCGEKTSRLTLKQSCSGNRRMRGPGRGQLHCWTSALLRALIGQVPTDSFSIRAKCFTFVEVRLLRRECRSWPLLTFHDVSVITLITNSW